MAKPACFAFRDVVLAPVLIAPENLTSFNMQLSGTLCCKGKVLPFV